MVTSPLVFNAACGFTITGIALLAIVWISRFAKREDTKIMMLTSSVLVDIIFIFSLAAFILLLKSQHGMTNVPSEDQLQEKATLVATTITHVKDDLAQLQASAPYQQAVADTHANMLPKLFTAAGYSAVRAYDANGGLITSVGNTVGNPLLTYKVKMDAYLVNILWKKAWYVRITSYLNIQNKKLGLLVVEKSLPTLDHALTGDMLVCLPSTTDNVLCYSSRLNGVTLLSHAPSISSIRAPIGTLGLSLFIQQAVSGSYTPLVDIVHAILWLSLLTFLMGFGLLRILVMPRVKKLVTTERESVNSTKRLQESEERYSLAAKASNAGLWDWKVDSNTVYCSTYFKSLLGYSENAPDIEKVEFLMNNVHPEDREKIQQLVKEHRELGLPFDTEIRIKRKYGDYHWFHVVGQSVRDDQGKAIRIAGLVTDVTETKKASQRLAAQYAVTRVLSETRNFEETSINVMQAICEHLDWDFGAMWMVDYQSGMIRCIGLWARPSLASEALTVVTRSTEYFIGIGLPGRVWRAAQPFWIYDVGNDKSFPRSVQALEAGLHSAFCFPILLHNKVFGVVEFFSCQRQSPDDELLKMMASVGAQMGQYAHRKLAESALRESEEYKTAILESANLSIMTLTDNGTLISFTPQTLDMFGFSALELQNKNVDLLLPSLSAKVKNFTDKVICEMTGVQKKGGSLFLEVTLSKMTLNKRNIFVCIARDVTTRQN